jgi:hypothetical protein
MALQLSRTPEIVSEDNRDSVLSSLCLAYIFNSSSRARALTLNALQTFSKKYSYSDQIKEILKDIKANFSEYDELTVEKELEKYHERLDALIKQI